MITAWVALKEVSGPHLRAALRANLRRQLPLVVIIDGRGQGGAAKSDRIAFTVQLRTLARRGGGDVVLIVDDNLQRRLRASGLDTRLNVTPTELDALAIATSLDRAMGRVP